MVQFQRFLRSNLNAILVLFLAGGFAVTLVELIITRHYEGTQLIAVVSTVLGLVGTLLLLVARRGWPFILSIILLLFTTVSGAIGIWEHFENAGRDVPPLAPLALTGLALIALVVAAVGWDPQRAQGDAQSDVHSDARIATS